MDLAFPTIVVFFVVIFWLMIAAGLALLIVWAVRSRSLSATTAAPMHDAPLDILARRFATGEISADEYKHARDLLSGGGRG